MEGHTKKLTLVLKLQRLISEQPIQMLAWEKNKSSLKSNFHHWKGLCGGMKKVNIGIIGTKVNLNNV